MSERARLSAVPVLACSGLAKTYSSGPQDVAGAAGVDLDVRARRAHRDRRRSGSGKSTLLHLLGGLDAPTAGDGHASTGATFATLSEAERGELRNRALGFVYQFHHLLPEFTAVENVAMPLLIRRMPPRDAQRARGRDARARSGWGTGSSIVPGELSGGERQRVALARALVTQAALRARRRADRQPRPAHRGGGVRPDARAERARRHAPRDRHARPRTRRAQRPHAASGRRRAARLTPQYCTGIGSSERHRYHVATLRHGDHIAANSRSSRRRQAIAVVVVQRRSPSAGRCRRAAGCRGAIRGTSGTSPRSSGRCP